jgi:hypothetical protein
VPLTTNVASSNPSLKSVNNRQCYGKRTVTNNDVQNTTQKTKYRVKTDLDKYWGWTRMLWNSVITVVNKLALLWWRDYCKCDLRYSWATCMVWNMAVAVQSFKYWNILTPLTLRVRTPLRRGVFDTTLCDKVCQWHAAGRWFSPGTPVSSTNKTNGHDKTDILLKVALNTITLAL